MSEQLHGKIEIRDAGHLQNTVISFDGSNGDVYIGGPPGGFGHRGRLIIGNRDGKTMFQLDGQTGNFTQRGNLTIINDKGETIIELRIDGNILAGGGGQDGDLTLRDRNGKPTVYMGADEQLILVQNDVNAKVIELNGKVGDVYVGGSGQDGDVIVRDKDGKHIIRLVGTDRNLVIQNAQGDIIVELGKAGNLRLGGGGEDGDVFVRNGAGNDTIWLRGQTGDAIFQGRVGIDKKELDSDVKLDVSGKTRTTELEVEEMTATTDLTVDGVATTRDLRVRGKVKSDITIEGTTTTKDLNVKGMAKGDLIVERKATMRGLDVVGDIAVKKSSDNTTTIRLLGDKGDIELLNADCAEDFDIADVEEIEPGTVMVLTQDGNLHQSTAAYDNKVVGIISGAGGYRPGIVLDQKPDSSSRRLPVALMGKVYCKVDANYAPISIGDMLTTSSTPGHAMKVTDKIQAFGAVIGKALHPLASGKALIPVLVTLQ